MPWTRGDALTDAHRSRLVTAGLDPQALAGLSYRAVTGPLPQWWHEGGNALYLRDGFDLPARLVELMVTYPFRDALVVVGTDLEALTCLLLGGDGATVYVGRDSHLSAGEIYCGGGSAVILTSGVVGTSRAQVDARNGGSVVADHDQLWAAGVYIATDDMHRLEDAATGQRINPYGAHIRLRSHVWLGRDAVVTGHVEIGEGAVVGMRSLVRGQKVPPGTAVAGTPARIIREGVVWRGEDTP
ncbi:hypothetical protein AB3X52_10940 [Nocardioides sp. DS6]|uniref:Acyltransferase n=1 Tax=Nocardioides eburneus TaxID=3231482 RepID=A0ABV3SYW6_9ACTN